MSGRSESFLDCYEDNERILESSINLSFVVESKQGDKEDNQENIENLEDKISPKETKIFSSNKSNKNILNPGDVNLDISLKLKEDSIE